MLTLRTFKLGKKKDRLTEADKTFLMILRLSDLDLDKLARLGEEDDPEKRRERQQGCGRWCRYFNKETLEWADST